jgi:hypothetical protein
MMHVCMCTRTCVCMYVLVLACVWRYLLKRDLEIDLFKGQRGPVGACIVETFGHQGAMSSFKFSSP